MKGVFKTAIFWPLTLVAVLLFAHIASQDLVGPKVDAYTTSELASFSRLLSAPLSLPAAMASGGAGISTSSLPLSIEPIGAVATADETALLSGATPLSSLKPIGPGIRTYIVRRGDAIASIAKRFGVSTGTIIWANSGISDPLRVGTRLNLLPVSGIIYSVQTGDTLASIASRFGVDQGLIQRYNADWQKIIASGTGALVLPYVTPTN